MMQQLTLQELSDYWYERANRTYEEDEDDFAHRYEFKEAWATYMFYREMAGRYDLDTLAELEHRKEAAAVEC